MIEQQPARFLPPREAYKRAGLSRVTIWKLEKAGQFPRAVKLTVGRKAYVESEVDAWIADRIARRNAEVMSDA